MIDVCRARPLLGTLVVVSAQGSRFSVDQGIAKAFKAVEAVERRMSYFNPTSDVSRLNGGAYDAPVVVHPQTYGVLRLAERLSLLSDGAFDVTAAGVLVRDGFLPHHASPAPDPRARYSDVRLGLRRRVRFRRRLWIDLGGIAKGFAVDQALAALHRSNVKKGWVNAGGDVAFFSDQPEPLWVRHPDRRDKMVSLGCFRQGALASSAPAYRAEGRDGRRATPYVCGGKTVDLRRGVTVAAPCALWADALTKIALLAPKKAPRVLAAFRSRAWVFERGGKNLAVREMSQ